MDPDATLAELITAQKNLDPTTATTLAVSLAEWLRSGGFAPVCTQDIVEELMGADLRYKIGDRGFEKTPIPRTALVFGGRFHLTMIDAEKPDSGWHFVEYTHSGNVVARWPLKTA